MTDISLPCLGLPVDQSERYPVRQTAAHDGPNVLIQESAIDEAKPIKEVTLVMENLNAADITVLLAAWDGGRGTCTPFSFTIPGDSASRSWVFRDSQLNLVRDNAAISGATTVLRQVSN